MATGTLQASGDNTAQLEQMIQTLGGVPFAGNIGELLKQINAALASFYPQGSSLAIGPAGAVGETIPRAVGAQSVTIATTAAEIKMQGIYLPANTVVNNITDVIGSTASSNDVTVNWAALCSAARVVLAATANATAQLTPAGVADTLALTAPFTTTAAGLYYVAKCISVTTTQPTLTGVTAAGTELNKIVPILSGASSTSGTSTPPVVGSTLGAITVSASSIYFVLT